MIFKLKCKEISLIILSSLYVQSTFAAYEPDGWISDPPGGAVVKDLPVYKTPTNKKPVNIHQSKPINKPVTKSVNKPIMDKFGKVLVQEVPVRPFSYVFALSIGPAWESNGYTQTFYLVPEVEKTYAADKSTTTLASGDLFLGIQKSLSNKIQGQLGVALAAAGNAKLSGNIWDDADPEFNNYTYNYQVNHAHIALKGKLLADAGYMVIPWISGSIGVGFNRAQDFSNTPIIFEAVENPDFSTQTKTAFTYTLGIGIQKALSTNWQVGIGYEFADWGKSELGRASGQTMNSGLTLNHLYTNGVLFNLTYLA